MNEIINTLIKFRDDRNWGQFHKPKDLALALSVEAAELLELFLWKQSDDYADAIEVEEELADVFICAFQLAEKYGFDVKEIVMDKIKKNARKYPVAR